MNDREEREKRDQKAEKQKRLNRMVLITAILTTPLFVVANPFCFFIALNFVDPFKAEIVWFSNAMAKFFGIAALCFAVITLLKYPLFVVKRASIKKESSFPLFYRINIVSQLPYLILLKLYQEYWTEDITAQTFAMLVVVVLSFVCYVGVLIAYNVMTMSIPADDE